MTLCAATKTDGKPCEGRAIEGSTYCQYHAPRLGRHDWDPTAPVLNEAAVTAAFCRWLEADGWVVTPELGFADVVATRDGVTLIAEAKGVTSDAGASMDILYGQILRRISDLGGSTRYALVASDQIRAAVERVSSEVRSHLGIETFYVSPDGTVEG